MRLPRPFKRPRHRRYVQACAAAFAVVITSAAALAGSASAQVSNASAPAVTALVRQITLFPYPALPAYNGYGKVPGTRT